MGEGWNAHEDVVQLMPLLPVFALLGHLNKNISLFVGYCTTKLQEVAYD